MIALLSNVRICRFQLDDQCRGPSIKERGHLARLLTTFEVIHLQGAKTFPMLLA